MSATQLTVDGARQLLMYSRESADRLMAILGQEDQIIAWAERHGYEIAGYARDNEVRGVTPADDREGLSAALIALQGPVRGLAVQYLDRIARDVNVMRDVVSRIWAAGRDLFSCDKGLIPRTRAGMRTCLDAARFAAEELAVLNRRLQDARRAKTARGGYSGGRRIRRRYGVELVPVGRRFEYRPVPEEQDVIRRVCAEHDNGIGYLRLSRALNAERIPTATGAAWSPKVVRDIVLRGPSKLTAVPTGADPARVSALVVPPEEREVAG